MRILNTLTLLFFATLAYAEGNDANVLAKFLLNTQTLEANFEQTLVDAQGVELDNSRGMVFLSRPSQYRWDYQHPYQQSIVTNGETLWFYDVELEQITIQDISLSAESTPSAIFGSYENIDKQFIITNFSDIEGFDWVELKPRDIDGQYSSIRLGFDNELLGMMVIFDNLDQVTRIDFTETIINKKLDDDIFNFKPPRGIDIIDERG